jgi:hypothetical protein
MLSSINVEAQLQVTVSIENQFGDGENFYFDIYLRRTSSSMYGDIYLANSDFNIRFNATYFNNPSLAFLNNSCNFYATNSSTNPSLFYSNNIGTSFSGNTLTINVNGPSPNESNFSSSIAKIDNVTLKHRLGRFVISGITNPSGTAGLEWITSGGLSTRVFSFENESPFQSVETSVVAVDPTDALLPVELISFDVNTLSGQTSKLQWQTAVEINNQGFDIERKCDTTLWQTLATVLPGNNGKYIFIDHNPFQGINYYRLKQVDFDGTYTYSPIKSVYIKKTNMEIYPNPVRSRLFIQGDPGTFFQVFDCQGKKYKDGIVKDQSINMTDLPSGCYVLSINGKNKKFVKW